MWQCGNVAMYQYNMEGTDCFVTFVLCRRFNQISHCLRPGAGAGATTSTTVTGHRPVALGSATETKTRSVAARTSCLSMRLQTDAKTNHRMHRSRHACVSRCTHGIMPRTRAIYNRVSACWLSIFPQLSKCGISLRFSFATF